MNVKWEYAWSKQGIRARLLAPQQGLLPYQKGGDGIGSQATQPAMLDTESGFYPGGCCV